MSGSCRSNIKVEVVEIELTSVAIVVVLFNAVDDIEGRSRISFIGFSES